MNELYILSAVILIVVVLVAALLDRWSVPVILVALGTGILFGSDVLGLLDFSNVGLTNQVANLALVFILFHGGFSTRREDFRSVALAAGGLATWGVVLTAAATFVILWGVLRWPLQEAMLLAVVISSTDAAATFSILRRQRIPRKLSSTLEIESAANDPMAILLTVAVVDAFTFGTGPLYTVALSFVWKAAAGVAIGWVLSYAAVWLFNRLRPSDRGHYYVLVLGVVLLMYGLAEEARASGMLTVFVAGYMIGNRPFVHKQGVTNFSAAISTIADISMFVLMGLLISPRQWATLWPKGVVLFLVLTLFARPVAVWLGTVGMKIGMKNRVFISWAGLRGAVPIILATYPLAAGLEVGRDVFNLVFFAVLMSVLIQGSSLGIVAKWLRLSKESRPQPLHNLELLTMAQSDMDLVVVDLPDPQGARGPRIRDVGLPEGSVIVLITRGEEVVVPKGNTHLEGWDRVTVLAHVKDEAAVRSALLDGEFVPRETEGGDEPSSGT